MKSPLRKRIPRELKGEIGKYLVVFILMVATIGLVSGFLVADGSMIHAYNEGFEKYNIEDGNFRLGERLYRGQKEAIEDEGIKVYENYYIEDSLSNGSTMRFFKNRTDVNKVCLMEGKLAEKTGEIAIDRMYADNNNLKVGDTIDDGTKSWKITGLVALSDYSCLFQNNSDTMFDAVKFGVGLVTEEEFDKVHHIFQSFGKAEKITENLMDAVVGVSGSGPAYVYMFIEAMADAGVAQGLPRKQAYTFAAQTLLGSAKMVLETGQHPGELKDAVCSPAGTTIEAVNTLEKKGFRSAVIEAVNAAAKKNHELGKPKKKEK